MTVDSNGRKPVETVHFPEQEKNKGLHEIPCEHTGPSPRDQAGPRIIWLHLLSSISVLGKNPSLQLYNAIVPIGEDDTRTFSGLTFPLITSGRIGQAKHAFECKI